MKGDRGSMGMHKHGTKGHAGKSPKMRLYLRMEAEKNERKRRGITDPKETVRELFAPKRPSR